MERRSFEEIHGYAREDETPEQTVKRLLTARLTALKKVSGSVAKLGGTPYKMTDSQRAYAIEIVNECVDTINASMTKTASDENPVEVPD